MSAIAICGYLWAVWVVLWMVWAFQSKQTKQRESFGSRMSYTLMVWGAGYLMFSAKGLGGWWRAEVVPYHAWMGWAGVALAVMGFGVTVWARAALGSNWSGTVTVKVEHELIRSGPYRWVRHPIYTGLLIALMGTELALDQWRGAAAVAVTWLAFSIKRLKEESFMRQTFGAKYIEYARMTGAIFPALPRR